MTEIPPNPRIKLDKIIFCARDFTCNELESFNPLVTSKNPDKMAFTTFSGIPKFMKKFAMKWKICDSLQMEIITENSTINPPIVNIKLIEFLMDSPKISPRLEKEMLGASFCKA